jgi:hypothetical protein
MPHLLASFHKVAIAMFRPIALPVIWCLLVLCLPLPAGADSRECFRPSQNAGKDASGSQKIEIVVANDDHPHFKDSERRCQHYWPYFSGKALKPDGTVLKQVECRKFPEALSLDQGYAPIGVFFRSRVSSPDSKVYKFEWEIRSNDTKANQPPLVQFDSFDAAYVFDTPGEYEATLKVSFADGNVALAKKRVRVWARDKATYYVDAEIGDDRFDGQSMQPQSDCRPESNAVGNCKGPWKTATRAFSVMDPRDWRMRATERYSTDSLCHSSVKKTAIRYPDGDYTQYRGQSTHYPNALKDTKGRFLPAYEIQVCEKVAPRMKSFVNPGDQILFKRGQRFDLETGMLSIESSKQTVDGQSHSIEKLTCIPLVSPAHWAAPLGILFSAYGTGTNPVIRNSGQQSCMAFHLIGVGVMHLAFQDLEFDLENPSNPSINKRASFMFAVGNPLNLVLNRVSLNRFDQGMQFHNGHGVFVKESRFHDSRMVHLYSDTALDVALLGNNFDYSGNHIAYTNMSNGLVVGNRFSRQAFGRTALRVYGSSLDKPAESVWISDNVFEGWIDPRTSASCADNARCQFADGKRYNYSLVELHPNTGEEDRFSERVVFTRNRLQNGEYLLRIGGTQDLIVKDNVFATLDVGGTPRIQLHSNMARRPLRNVLIEDNLFIEQATSVSGEPSPQIELTDYSSAACTDQASHSGIKIRKNRSLTPKATCFVRHASSFAQQRKCLSETSKKQPEPTRGGNYSINDNRFEVMGASSLAATEIRKKTDTWKKYGRSQQ